MKEHPILFSTEMVKAILEGRKSQTRRIIKPQPIDNREVDGNFFHGNHKGYVKVDGHPLWQQQFAFLFCPYGQIGDRLWVRETFYKSLAPDGISYPAYYYKVSHDGNRVSDDDTFKWKPSIFMPKEACRIRLKITDIRVERVQDISEEDAIAEGMIMGECYENCSSYACTDCTGKFYTNSFKHLWKLINGEESWNKNVWVWVIEFKKERQE